MGNTFRKHSNQTNYYVQISLTSQSNGWLERNHMKSSDTKKMYKYILKKCESVNDDEELEIESDNIEFVHYLVNKSQQLPLCIAYITYKNHTTLSTYHMKGLRSFVNECHNLYEDWLKI